MFRCISHRGYNVARWQIHLKILNTYTPTLMIYTDESSDVHRVSKVGVMVGGGPNFPNLMALETLWTGCRRRKTCGCRVVECESPPPK